MTSEQTGIVPEVKTWTEPQLTILIRDSREEAVLATCKNVPDSGGLVNRNVGCYNTGGTGCVRCDGLSSS